MMATASQPSSRIPPLPGRARVLSCGEAAATACTLEVLAPKAGNVHPTAAFPDVDWQGFLVSALVCRPHLQDAAGRGVGATVLACVRATQAAVGCNTNLGMVLLLAPLCAADSRGSAGKRPRRADLASLRSSLDRILASLSASDARDVYQAIREAKPGGLGKAPRGDVRREPALPLLEAMRLASPRDAVARQYVNGFADVFDRLAPALADAAAAGMPLDHAIVRTHLQQMAFEPDSLIARKAGPAIARQVQRRAHAVLLAGWPQTRSAAALFQRLDRWLRFAPPASRSHPRNPGTSADLIAAALHVALRCGLLPAPWNWSTPLPEDLPHDSLLAR